MGIFAGSSFAKTRLSTGTPEPMPLRTTGRAIADETTVGPATKQTVRAVNSRRGEKVGRLGQPAAPCPTAWVATWACRACSASAWVGLRSNTTSFTVPVNAKGALGS
jgi:hypothetical protein